MATTWKYDRAYLYSFIVALILCWSPSKLVAYFAPWFVIGIFFVLTRSRSVASRLVLVLICWLLALPFYAILTPNFVWHSAALWLLTYSAFIFLCVVSVRKTSPELNDSILRIARWVLLFEGAWGLIQGLIAGIQRGTFDGAVGDSVAGTIRPFTITPDISNAMFSVNIAMLLTVLLPSVIIERKGKLAFVIGLLALILASTLHVLFFLVIALVFAFILYYPSFFLRKQGCLLIFGFLLSAAVASSLLTGNISTTRAYVRFTLAAETPRAQVVIRAVTDMPSDYPLMPLVGLGPGQFSSRASLIGTGMYFGTPANPTPLPLLPEGMSLPFQEHLLDLWLSLFFDSAGNYVHTMNNTSSTVQPYFSWLSLYSEFGLLGCGIVILATLGLLLRALRHRRSGGSPLIATCFSAGILFTLLLGIQDNYWEIPQAIFPGLLILKAQYSSFRPPVSAIQLARLQRPANEPQLVS